MNLGISSIAHLMLSITILFQNLPFRRNINDSRIIITSKPCVNMLDLCQTFSTTVKKPARVLIRLNNFKGAANLPLVTKKLTRINKYNFESAAR